MQIIECLWLPRSYLHVYEVSNKIGKSSFLKISNKKIDENGIRFTVNKVYKFSLNPYGLYSLETTSKKDTKTVRSELRKILIHEIIKTSHSVTYKQLMTKSIPKTSITIQIGGKNEYDVQNPYTPQTITALNKKEGLQIAQALLLGQFMYTMMNKMEKLYHLSTEVSKNIETKDELFELKKIILDMDVLEKNVSESHSKVIQTQNILNHLKKQKHSNTVKKLYIQLELDNEYLTELWNLIENYLDRVDNAAGSKIGFQESIESQKIESLLSVETASTVAIITLSLLFGTEILEGNRTKGILTIIVWIALYLALSGVLKVRKLKRKKVKT